MICMKSGAQLEQTDQIVSFFVLFRFALKPGDLAPQALQAFPLQFLSLFVLRLHICFFDAHTGVHGYRSVRRREWATHPTIYFNALLPRKTGKNMLTFSADVWKFISERWIRLTAVGTAAALLMPGRMQPGDPMAYGTIAFGCPAMGGEALAEMKSQPALDVCRALGKAFGGAESPPLLITARDRLREV